MAGCRSPEKGQETQMTQQIKSVAVEATDLDKISAIDLRKIAATEGGYEAYILTPVGADGYRQSVAAQMIWHAEAGRAGIAWGADADWTDAQSPEDAAERFFGINDKEMCN